MKSDLHHLLPTDGKANGMRSNYPHAEVTSATWTSSNGSKLGNSVTAGYSGKAFEVPDKYKGDIARIYFYMVTRYQDKLSGWKNFATFSKNSYPSLSSWAITLYLKWSDMDPVSEKEITRNEVIYGFQNNRNPFVDHPEFAHRIWDSAK
jgi:endonuclease I